MSKLILPGANVATVSLDPRAKDPNDLIRAASKLGKPPVHVLGDLMTAASICGAMLDVSDDDMIGMLRTVLPRARNAARETKKARDVFNEVKGGVRPQ